MWGLLSIHRIENENDSLPEYEKARSALFPRTLAAGRACDSAVRNPGSPELSTDIQLLRPIYIPFGLDR